MELITLLIHDQSLSMFWSLW